MKKLLIFLLTLSILLVSCGNANDSETTAPETTDKVTEENKIDYIDIEDYMKYFVNYFHAPYKAGDDISDKALLSMCFRFAVDNRDLLDYVTESEIQTLNIKGSELQKVAETLIGENVDLKKYHDNMENTSAYYASETDTYTVGFGTDYWGEDPYYLAEDEPLKITDEGECIKVTAKVLYIPTLGNIEKTQYIEYTFIKTELDGVGYYRIDEIKSDSVYYRTHFNCELHFSFSEQKNAYTFADMNGHKDEVVEGKCISFFIPQNISINAGTPIESSLDYFIYYGPNDCSIAFTVYGLSEFSENTPFDKNFHGYFPEGNANYKPKENSGTGVAVFPISDYERNGNITTAETKNGYDYILYSGSDMPTYVYIKLSEKYFTGFKFVSPEIDLETIVDIVDSVDLLDDDDKVAYAYIDLPPTDASLVPKTPEGMKRIKYRPSHVAPMNEEGMAVDTSFDIALNIPERWMPTVDMEYNFSYRDGTNGRALEMNPTIVKVSDDYIFDKTHRENENLTEFFGSYPAYEGVTSTNMPYVYYVFADQDGYRLYSFVRISDNYIFKINIANDIDTYEYIDDILNSIHITEH